nr:sugar ABC transporter permease [Allostreptomyces psammosilenae]
MGRYLNGPGGEWRGRELGAVPVVLGLVAMWAVFQILDDNFLSPRNLSNLSVDIVGTGMIAVGVVFVLLLGEIDLSVASVSGLAAATFAVLTVYQGVPEWLALIVAVLTGSAAGALHGFFFARVGVPAFMVTLAGLLGWNGLMLYVLGAVGTITLHNLSLITSLTSHYFPDAAAYALAAVSTAVFFLVSHQQRRRRAAAGTPSGPLAGIVLRTALLAVVAFAAAHTLNRFRGLPLALLIFLLVVAGLDYVLRRTPYGRRVAALGGGVEAARRAGINLVTMRISVLVISGTMAAVGGLFLASRVTSVGQTSGTGILLLNVIAAAVIGGTSLFGGRGRTWSALLGILVIQSLASGMALLGISSAVQLMVTGAVLLGAMVLDSLSHRRQHPRAAT